MVYVTRGARPNECGSFSTLQPLSGRAVLMGEDAFVVSTARPTSPTGLSVFAYHRISALAEKLYPGKLVVFELSAENGKRIHVAEVPLQLRSG